MGEASKTKTKIRAPADDAALWRRFRGHVGEDVKATPVYRLSLNGSSPEAFTYHLQNFIAPNAMRAEALMEGIWRIGQGKLTLEDGAPPWSAAAPSRHYADRLHRFDWLPDLLTQGEAGAERARSLVDAWCEEFAKFNGFSWRLGVTADRIWNWLLGGPAVFDVGSDEDKSARIDALMRQVRHLEKSLDTSVDPEARWRGACVLIAVSLALLDGKGLDAAIYRLEAECTAQILADGGHVSRAPERLMHACADLLSLRDLFDRAGRPEPDYIGKWLPRMAAMLSFFIDGDGALSSFNSGGEARSDVINGLMDALGREQRRFSFAMKSGFQKLEKGGTRLVLDCGEAPGPPFGDTAHAGALNFELSDGTSRIVTSCGHSPDVNVDWQAAVRRTGAHSTLVLGGRDSAAFATNDQTRLLSPVGPQGISAKRLEEGDEIWLDAQHSGYKDTYGLLHRRRLFMAADGSRLAGEDSLVRPVSSGDPEDAKFISFEIRFHLHPTITAMTAGDVIELTSDYGPVWRFKTTHEGTRLEPSVYLSCGQVETTEQIVMSGRADPMSDGTEPPNCIKWAFLRDKGR